VSVIRQEKISPHYEKRVFSLCRAGGGVDPFFPFEFIFKAL